MLAYNASIQNNTLFVGNLSILFTAQHLALVFSNYGEVVDVQIKRSPREKKSLSYGFVKFLYREDAEIALHNLNSTIVLGRPLRVSWASKYAKEEYDRTKRPDLVQVLCSFISKKRDNGVTEQSLRAIFEQYGPVSDVAIRKSAMRSGSNVQSGYAFISFNEDDEGIATASAIIKAFNNCVVQGVLYDCRASKLSGNILKDNSTLDNQSNGDGSSSIDSEDTLVTISTSSDESDNSLATTSIAVIDPTTQASCAPPGMETSSDATTDSAHSTITPVAPPKNRRSKSNRYRHRMDHNRVEQYPEQMQTSDKHFKDESALLPASESFQHQQHAAVNSSGQLSSTMNAAYYVGMIPSSPAGDPNYQQLQQLQHQRSMQQSMYEHHARSAEYWARSLHFQQSPISQGMPLEQGFAYSKQVNSGMYYGSVPIGYHTFAPTGYYTPYQHISPTGPFPAAAPQY